MTFKLDQIKLRQHTKMLIIAFFDALIAQFYFDSVPFEFKFSISVAILPVYYYFDRSLNPIKTSIYVASVGLIFRTLTGASVAGGFINAFWSDFPFLYFDLFYGVIFYVLYFKKEKVSLQHWALVVVFADWIGNTIEAIFRHGLPILLESNSTMIFFLVALIRVAIGLAIVTFFKQYTLLIRKDEHEFRYKQLLMLTSDLKSEAYFMQKNMDYIEYVMEDAYHLYSELENLPAEEAQKISLKIATDIHEIKKNYSRVVEGLGNITDGEIDYSHMKIVELVRILKFSINRYLNTISSDIIFVTSVHTTHLFKEHYLLMSVLRNLVNNAIEELVKSNPHGTVRLKYSEDKTHMFFSVVDNGSGIDEKDLEYIFETGFSTKFNEETGNICRGVGLALVKNIVEKELNGQIEVVSKIGIGTEFKVTIPK